MKKVYRTYTSWGYRGEHGKSSVFIMCPFCGEQVVAYVWSLCGSGKRCPECRAVHHSFGTSKEVPDHLVNPDLDSEYPDCSQGIVAYEAH